MRCDLDGCLLVKSIFCVRHVVVEFDSVMLLIKLASYKIGLRVRHFGLDWDSAMLFRRLITLAISSCCQVHDVC